LESKPFELINGRNLPPKPQEVVLRDNEKLLSAYTIGDAKAGMVTHKTTNALILLWNAPGISKETMEEALKKVTTYARRCCGGHLEQGGILP
jgi:DNA/RNA-binding domain of Phe-tRNA-synthetase-like protein